MQFVRHGPVTFQEDYNQAKADMEKCTTITWKQIKKTDTFTRHQESTKQKTKY